jgi:hypothetical protein
VSCGGCENGFAKVVSFLYSRSHVVSRDVLTFAAKGGNAPGGNAPGGNAPGGNAPGGNSPGGNARGGNSPGGNAPGGNAPKGGTTGGGAAAGGATTGATVTATNTGGAVAGGYAQGVPTTGAYAQGASNTGAYAGATNTGAYAQGATNTGAYAQGATNTGAYAQGATNTGAYAQGATNTGAYAQQGSPTTGAYSQSATTTAATNPSNLDDTPLIDDAMLGQGFWSQKQCKVVTYNETFYFETAAHVVGVGGDPKAIGSQFIFSQNLFTPTGTPIQETHLSGVCTRTAVPGTGILGKSGAGTCSFNLVDTFGNYTVGVQGYLDTVPQQMSAGSLLVTGGSGSMVSVVGEMNVIPVNSQGHFDTSDIFTGIYAYFIQAAFGVIVCPRN